MITRAYRVVSVRDVDPGDSLYTPGGPIKLDKVESTADGVKLSGKRTATDKRAIPIEVKRGADVILVASHGVLDDLETVLADRLDAYSTKPGDAAAGPAVTVGTGVITVAAGDITWTIPRRGHEDEWLQSIMPAPPVKAKPEPPADPVPPPTSSPATPPKVAAKDG